MSIATPTSAFGELAARWRNEAETFRSYGETCLATACEKHADELEAAAQTLHFENVTLEEAAEAGGYSYSHLQHLVAEGTIPNVGRKGDPRIRRCDIPRKPGHGVNRGASKKDTLDRTLRLHRQGGEG